MLSTVQNAAEQMPWQAWAALLSLTTLAIGYALARRTRPTATRKPRDKAKQRTLIGFLGMGLVVVLGFASPPTPRSASPRRGSTWKPPGP
jgi:drug/metabolite transporter (DMT)-like permease